uniref:Uncharacterized protein LOC105083604 n=1 Tax=Camelus bactrianus TaxID=9837 RepID=A0A9W3FF65_CAMBA|nr:uncharacterized protein LOC105083604 [Camelus bactrianus]
MTRPRHPDNGLAGSRSIAPQPLPQYFALHQALVSREFGEVPVGVIPDLHLINHIRLARLGSGVVLVVTSEIGLHGLASPPPVIVHGGQRGVTAEVSTSPQAKSTAATLSSGSLMATHDHYQRRLGSASRNSSCGSAEYPGKAIPHHPGLPKANPGHWWASFFFGKSTLPFMAIVSPEHWESSQKTSTGTITCDLAREAMGKQQSGSQPGKTNSSPRPEWPPSAARLPSKALGS